MYMVCILCLPLERFRIFFVNTILKFSQFPNAIRFEWLYFHAACFVYLFRLSSLTRLKGYYTSETLTS